MSLFRKCADGYIGVADGKRTVLLHVVVAMLAMKKPLPKGAVVHHIDGDKKNNWSCNLVVCQNQAYHKLIHQRTDALNACGNAGWLKCKFCGKYDAPENLRIYKSKTTGRHTESKNIHHQSCNADYLRNRYHLRKGSTA